MSGTRRFLLLQARNPGDYAARHEHECFAEALGVPLESIRPHDLLGGAPTDRELEGTDAILVGGSGEYSVLDDVPFIKDYLGFLDRVVVGRGVPTFASCFGFQGLVVAGGGEVVHDPDNTEVGTFEIHLTAEGTADPLLGDLAPTFKAQLGHKDRAARLPAGMTHLARSERAPFQALRVAGVPVFATQFHPELSREANTARYLRYIQLYGRPAAGERDEVLDSMDDTPEATSIMRRFFEGVLAE